MLSALASGKHPEDSYSAPHPFSQIDCMDGRPEMGITSFQGNKDSLHKMNLSLPLYNKIDAKQKYE
jgi:hypothetical protein